jgi:hypothetical protein
MTFDNSASKLTSNGVSPVTVMFSDRPERIAANMRAAEFVPFWSKGKDRFLSDPPNADVSILEDGPLRQIVVVPQDPTQQGDNLTNTVRVLQGEMPTTRSECRCLSSSQFPQGVSPQKLRGPLHRNLTSGLPFILAWRREIRCCPARNDTSLTNSACKSFVHSAFQLRA